MAVFSKQAALQISGIYLFELRSLGGAWLKKEVWYPYPASEGIAVVPAKPVCWRAADLWEKFSYAGALFPPVHLQSHIGMFLLQTLLKHFRFPGFGDDFSGIYWLAPCSLLFCLHETVLP